MKIKSSKRFKKLLELSKDKKTESIENAIQKVKKNCTSKFDESIDVSFLLNLKSRKIKIFISGIQHYLKLFPLPPIQMKRVTLRY